MRQVALCVALALSLSVITLALIAGVHPLIVGNLTMAGATICLVIVWKVLRRDRAVRKLVVTALDCDGAVVNVKTLVRVLGTPDVVQAREEHLRRENLWRAQLYANGESSDY